jgi:hypothetical protein
MKSLVVCVSLLIVASCGTEGTSPNGSLQEFHWDIPPLQSVFYFSYSYRTSTGADSRTSSFDSVWKVDSIEAISISVMSQRQGAVKLTFDGSSLLHSATLLNGLPRSSVLPVAPNHYSIERDSVIAPNGFYLGTAKYIETGALLGSSYVIVGKRGYETSQYRSIQNLYDTIGAPSQILDTLEADFAPDLGYFTRLKETRYYEGSAGITIYQITATLDSARR